MNIDELKPGRELDALIAEKVMGIKLEKSQIFDGPGYYCASTYIIIPTYSTDITFAWEVVEKMKKMLGCRFFIYDCHEDGTIEASFFASRVGGITEVPDGMLATAKSIPHAICLAALRAMDG